MLIVISPAKTLDYEKPAPVKNFSIPAHLEDSEKLIRKLRTVSRKKLADLMGISKNLAQLNYERYLAWNPDFNLENAKQAMFAFKGDVYLGLEAETFTNEDIDFAQEHLRILSGLYGLLRPLDLMQAYRLEMGTRLPVRRKKNLYEFWDSKITDDLNVVVEGHQEKVLLNLASNEYFSSVKTDQFKGQIVTPVFRDWKNGQYKIISFFAKKARGRMTSWIIRHRLENVADIKDYNLDGYIFSGEISSVGEWIFTRKES